MKYFRKATNKQLGQLLIERGVVNHEQLQKALEYKTNHVGLIGEIFVKLKFATEKDIAQALTCQYGFPYLPLSNYEIEEDVLTSVSEVMCREYCLVPIDKIGKSLTVAMSNPLDAKAVDEIEKATGCVVQSFVSTATEIKQSIEKYYPFSL